MEVMDEFNVRGSVSLSAAVCQHHPEIIEACNKRKWEFFSHGILQHTLYIWHEQGARRTL